MTQSCVTVPAAAITENELSVYQMPQARQGKKVPERIYSETVWTDFFCWLYFLMCPFAGFKLTPPLHLGVQQGSEG